MGTDQNGDEPGKGMVSGGDTVLWKSGICAGKDTGVNSPAGRKGTFDGRFEKVPKYCIRRRFLIIAITGVNTNYVPYLARFLEREVRA